MPRSRTRLPTNLNPNQRVVVEILLRFYEGDQTRLAADLDMSRQAVWTWISDTRGPNRASMERIAALARKHGTSIDEIRERLLASQDRDHEVIYYHGKGLSPGDPGHSAVAELLKRLLDDGQAKAAEEMQREIAKTAPSKPSQPPRKGRP